MKHLRKDHTIPFGLGGILPLALCMMRVCATPLGEGFVDDFGIGGESFGFLEWHIEGFGDNRFNPVHAPVIVI